MLRALYIRRSIQQNESNEQDGMDFEQVFSLELFPNLLKEIQNLVDVEVEMSNT